MPSGHQSPSTSSSLDGTAYQQYWESLPRQDLEKYRGQSIALERTGDGWSIVAADSDLEQLVEDLRNSGADLSRFVFDQVHVDDHTAAGIELL